MTIAYQGAPGAFSHEACLRFLPEHEPQPRASFADVIAAVADGETELGILPVENSCAGAVAEAQALLADCSLAVIATHSLPVRMHLLALPGATMASVRTVTSHPVALAQSARTLAALGFAVLPADNTAGAARALAAAGDRSAAVLASEAAAARYGLTILRHDVHDEADNATRFCVLARAPR